AIVASNDEMGAGVIIAAHRLGLSVPGDLSVVGFDDMPYASMTWPPLTTIHQPIGEMGAAAAQILLEQISPNDVPSAQSFSSMSSSYASKLRESTGPARPRHRRSRYPHTNRPAQKARLQVPASPRSGRQSWGPLRRRQWPCTECPSLP